MLNFINEILNYFWYEVQECETIKTWILEIKQFKNNIEELDSNNFKLFKEKDRLINLVADKDKDILSLEHKIENFKWVIEQDKLTIEDLNKQTVELSDKIAILESNVLECLKQIDWYKQLSNERYKELNTLRSREKALRESRDNYKHKYREVCWKIALKKACHKQ